jgi:hypothetical protein
MGELSAEHHQQKLTIAICEFVILKKKYWCRQHPSICQAKKLETDANTKAKPYRKVPKQTDRRQNRQSKVCLSCCSFTRQLERDCKNDLNLVNQSLGGLVVWRAKRQQSHGQNSTSKISGTKSNYYYRIT